MPNTEFPEGEHIYTEHYSDGGSDDISYVEIANGVYTRNDNFIGAMTHQFGIEPDSSEPENWGSGPSGAGSGLEGSNPSPGQSEIDHIEVYQYTVYEENNQALVSNNMDIETEFTTISLYFDKADYLFADDAYGGFMSRGIQIVHYDDGVPPPNDGQVADAGGDGQAVDSGMF